MQCTSPPTVNRRCFKVKLFEVHSFRFDKISAPAWLDDISFLEAVRGIKRHFADMKRGRVFRDRYCCQCNYFAAVGQPACAAAFRASSSHSQCSVDNLRHDLWQTLSYYTEEEKDWRSAERDLGHLELF